MLWNIISILIFLSSLITFFLYMIGYSDNPDSESKVPFILIFISVLTSLIGIFTGDFMYPLTSILFNPIVNGFIIKKLTYDTKKQK